MKNKSISFCGQNLVIRYLPQAATAVDIAFAGFSAGNPLDPVATFDVLFDQETDSFSVTTEGEEIGAELDLADLTLLLSARAAYEFACTITDGLVIYGAAVQASGGSILIPGRTENSRLIAWLVQQGYKYLTSELICLAQNDQLFASLPCPLFIRQEERPVLEPIIMEFIAPKNSSRILRSRTGMVLSSGILSDDFSGEPAAGQQKLAFLLFAEYQQNSRFSLESVSPAQATGRLMGCLANHHKLGTKNVTRLAALTRQIPALSLRYADLGQLENILPPILDFILAAEGTRPNLQRAALKAFSRLTAAEHPPQKQLFLLQQATPPGKKRKITIGMATYDDFDGVYFSVQALRMYHPEIIDQCEILVIDNHPDGPCAESLKKLDTSIDGYRYVPLPDVQGTAAGRNALFQHAGGDYVLCMDCHVFLVPGAVHKLAEYFSAHPDSPDLLQGPMIHDNLKSISTHFKPVWRGGMYGVWGHDPRGDDPAGEPFDIPMQGVGLFACRRKAWPGFNPSFYGFGADEGYIHEKFRQAGGRTLCLPFLRWLHRFDRPMGAPYPVHWKDRIHNYLLGFTELGLDTAPVKDHFTKLLGAEKVAALFKEIEKEIAGSPSCP
ncbi:MAG: glycosyltransferase family 2 protein [Candidatus Electrothrix sp. YB6]